MTFVVVSQGYILEMKCVCMCACMCVCAHMCGMVCEVWEFCRGLQEVSLCSRWKKFCFQYIIWKIVLVMSTYYWQCIEIVRFLFFTWLWYLDYGPFVETRVILIVMSWAVYLSPTSLLADIIRWKAAFTHIIHAFVDQKYSLSTFFVLSIQLAVCWS